MANVDRVAELEKEVESLRKEAVRLRERELTLLDLLKLKTNNEVQASITADCLDGARAIIRGQKKIIEELQNG